jgi:hypothetical protein
MILQFNSWIRLNESQESSQETIAFEIGPNIKEELDKIYAAEIDKVLKSAPAQIISQGYRVNAGYEVTLSIERDDWVKNAIYGPLDITTFTIPILDINLDLLKKAIVSKFKTNFIEEDGETTRIIINKQLPTLLDNNLKSIAARLDYVYPTDLTEIDLTLWNKIINKTIQIDKQFIRLIQTRVTLPLLKSILSNYQLNTADISKKIDNISRDIDKINLDNNQEGLDGLLASHKYLLKVFKLEGSEVARLAEPVLIKSFNRLLGYYKSQPALFKALR